MIFVLTTYLPRFWYYRTVTTDLERERKDTWSDGVRKGGKGLRHKE